MRFKLNKYYATMEVYDNLVDMHTPGLDNGKIYHVFRENDKQVGGSWYYFIPTTIDLFWLWKIISENERQGHRNVVGYVDDG